MSFVVLDTSIASMMLDERPTLRLYLPWLINNLAVLSFQTVAEMRLGANLADWGERRLARVEQYFDDVLIQQQDDKLILCWVQIMREARQAGRRLESGDGWIAATALLLNAPLLTHDKDFDAQACPSITVICHADQSPTP